GSLNDFPGGNLFGRPGGNFTEFFQLRCLCVRLFLAAPFSACVEGESAEIFVYKFLSAIFW
ncbi:MAG: hypothetical protein K2M55_01660, partial [Muribaculaceae bacterium]|nr:hypothetical protein [Muribaculaceae bacterium]